jgi:hypothetical protein
MFLYLYETDFMLGLPEKRKEACVSYDDFLDIGLPLTRKLQHQGFRIVVKFNISY